MKRNRILFIAIALIIVGCSLAADKMVKIDYELWNTNTFRFIESKCAIQLNDSIQLGGIVTPIKEGSNTYFIFRDYLESKIKGRSQLIKYLEAHDKLDKDIHIFESYSGNKASIIVLDGKKELSSFTISKEGLNIIATRNEGHINELFSPLERDEQECFSEDGGIPQHISFFSRYDNKSESVKTYQVSMYN